MLSYIKYMQISSIYLTIVFVLCYVQEARSEHEYSQKILAEKLHSALEKHFNIYKISSYKANTSSYTDSPLLPEPNMLRFKEVHKIWINYPKYKAICTTWYRIYHNRKLITGQRFDEGLQDGKRYLHVEYKDEFKNVLSMAIRTDDLFIPNEILYNIRGEKKNCNHRFIDYDNYRIEQNNPNEYNIHYSNDYGHYTIVISYRDDKPDRFEVKKIRIVVNRNNLYVKNRPLYLLEPISEAYEPQKTRVEQYVQTISYDNYKEIDGEYIFTYVKNQEEKLFSNGQKVVCTDIYEFSDISFNREDIQKALNVLVPSANIPNGTRVAVLDQEGIEYEWRDGQVVKKIPQRALAKLPNILEFHGGNLISRGLIIILICLILTLATAALLYYRHRNKLQENNK